LEWLAALGPQLGSVFEFGDGNDVFSIDVCIGLDQRSRRHCLGNHCSEHVHGRARAQKAIEGTEESAPMTWFTRNDIFEIFRDAQVPFGYLKLAKSPAFVSLRDLIRYRFYTRRGWS
jgi:hypothetical protein